MRSIKAGAYAGALGGALLLLGGCTVPDEPPVAGSTLLDDLSGREFLEVCDWAYDYMGGDDYQHPDADREDHGAVHYCPPTEEELALPEEERVYFQWDDEFCKGLISVLGGSPECPATVDDFTRVVYEFAESPCRAFSVETAGNCVFTWSGRDDF